MPPNKRIAVWMSEKKLQKVNWQEFVSVSNKHGFELFKLDLNKNLEGQAPFCVLLHKLTDIIASANQGDLRSMEIITDVEKYLEQNPTVVVVDPIPNVKKLLDRYNCYSIIHATNLHSYGVFTPNFCVLRNDDLDSIREQLTNSLVTYPFICKPILGHGSRQAHEMSIIFDEKYLVDCKTPCVAQSFINHNAILYKIFIVGNKFCFVERPSLKNFHASQRESIYFDSSDVSKADSKSRLSVLDPGDVVKETWEPDPKVMEVIANTLRKSFGMDLLGIDVVIDKSTGRYAIIDVNAYPGYDGFPDFFEAVLECISNKVTSD
ncbi:inositol-tetrakisphosphate 1-kinase-like isoform X2 [Sitophilus oryzae]|uniref:Inositol-tetrakisphosphate 1-kinase n=1 Tax=Sitophilus oryzae TaxID=7048 RepID=A0A6J2YAX1_SITOR|nr:inositol-tetrakisphosphate 1-kinase-like isoform X2 [Sitophilus oryzae]